MRKLPKKVIDLFWGLSLAARSLYVELPGFN